mgnify:CR=1 FL=1
MQASEKGTGRLPPPHTKDTIANEGASVMNNKTAKTDKTFGTLPATGAIVLKGPYAELAKFIDEIAEKKPVSVHLIYRRFSPGKLLVREAGDSR